uniref:Uncharacterized protein n=1 Tax=Mesocestoides corti TaxID=53468 RepID=A0A5K3FDM1_MESCO
MARTHTPLLAISNPSLAPPPPQGTPTDGGGNSWVVPRLLQTHFRGGCYASVCFCHVPVRASARGSPTYPSLPPTCRRISRRGWGLPANHTGIYTHNSSPWKGVMYTSTLLFPEPDVPAPEFATCFMCV